MNFIVELVSNLLSIFTIALCFIMKIPQILTLYKSSSTVGLSLKASLLQLASYTTTCMYNYTNSHAVLSYLEYPVLIIQEYIMIGLLLKYSNYHIKAFFAVIIIFGIIKFAFAYEVLSKTILKILLPMTTPVGGLSKVMQLIEILRSKNADSVSAITWFISAFTNIARIFTILVDSADFHLLVNFSVSSVLSSSVLAATLYYQRLSKTPVKKE